MMSLILQYGVYLLILVVLAIPLGNYIGKVMNGERVFLSKILVPCESFIYKVLHVDKNEDMGWKKYSFSIIAFSLISLVILFFIHLCQGFLPLNPENIKGTSLDLAFNNAISFVTNTNWQAYSGESSLSYFTQMIGLTVQNFVSPAVGMCVLFARFVPMLCTLAIAGSLVQKKKVAESSGTLPTHNMMFIGLLIFIVLLIGALSFFPALALGPIAEFLYTIKKSYSQGITLFCLVHYYGFLFYARFVLLYHSLNHFSTNATALL